MELIEDRGDVVMSPRVGEQKSSRVLAVNYREGCCSSPNRR